jgi:hypothetical protein
MTIKRFGNVSMLRSFWVPAASRKSLRKLNKSFISLDIDYVNYCDSLMKLAIWESHLANDKILFLIRVRVT